MQFYSSAPPVWPLPPLSRARFPRVSLPHPSTKTLWYGEATSHGYPREKAEQTRINTLVKILEWCGKLGADYVAFEDLTWIKRKRFTESPYANRKIAKFPKKQLLIHGVIRAMRLGFTVIMVDPSGTSSSKTHRQIMRERGLDRHMASAYIIAYRGLKTIIKNCGRQYLPVSFDTGDGGAVTPPNRQMRLWKQTLG